MHGGYHDDSLPSQPQGVARIRNVMINLIYTENIYNITDYGYADNLPVLSFFIQDFFLYEALLEIVHYQHIIAICHHNFE